MNDVNKIFHKVPVEVPNKSGFDMSFENLLTAHVGTLTPALCEFLLPNDTISLGANLQVQLPPMATDFYGRISAKMEAFFVPARLLYGGWQELMTHPTNGDVYPSASSTGQKARFLPYILADSSKFSPGSLGDYLGVKLQPAASATNVTINNPLPFVAYHKIWSDWYRDSRIQRDCFSRPDGYSSGVPQTLSTFGYLPYVTRYDTSPVNFSNTLSDGFNIYDLRQRNWGKDYFTNATTLPQAGQGSNLAFSVNTPSGQTTGTGTFSIASLRAANAIQQWMERNNIAGYRYGDQIKARFGVYPSDAILDRSIYLGSMSIDVFNKSIYQTVQTSVASSSNPFNSIAAKYGSPQGYGDGSLVESFTATEYGYIFVMFSLVPYAYYGTGSRKHFMCNSQADFPDPLLAGVGDEPIYKFELGEDLYTIDDTSGIFGYTQRFSDYKFVNDQVHGLLRDGESLESFALQRSFQNALGLSLNSSFLEIPKNFLDQVSAVQSSVSEYGCWADIYFKFKKASTLPAYSIPTLGDMKDTHTEIIDNGGKRL